MRRTVVAINTIHAPFLAGRDLFCTWPASAIVILGYLPIAILHANPGNNLPLLVTGDESNLVTEVHMPVNARYRPASGIAAADVNQHARLSQRVLFVVSVVIES